MALAVAAGIAVATLHGRGQGASLTTQDEPTPIQRGKLTQRQKEHGKLFKNKGVGNIHDLAGQRRFEEFTAQTGGAVFIPHTTAELNEAFTQIAADLSHQYVLSYYPSTADPRDGRFRSFTLNVKNRTGLRVRTRKGYYAPKG